MSNNNGSGSWNTNPSNNLLSQNPSIKNITAKNLQNTPVGSNTKFQQQVNQGQQGTSQKNMPGMNITTPVISITEPRRSVYTNSQQQM